MSRLPHWVIGARPTEDCWGLHRAGLTIRQGLSFPPPRPNAWHTVGRWNMVAELNRTFGGFCRRWREVGGSGEPSTQLLAAIVQEKLGPSRWEAKFLGRESQESATRQLEVIQPNLYFHEEAAERDGRQGPAARVQIPAWPLTRCIFLGK